MKALKTLKDLDYQDKLSKYPTVPPRAIAAGNFTDKTANGLTNCIVRWMELHGHYATRITSMGRQLPTTKVVDVIGRMHTMAGAWIPGTTKRGTADIHAVVNGRHVSIEVKIGLDRMSEAQHQTKKEIESSGGCFFVAKSFAGFVDFYKALI